MFYLRLAILIVLFLGFVCSFEDMESLHDMYLKEQIKIRSEICAQKPEFGKCKGRRNLWYYNQHASKCQMFIYSNCGGNRNRFYSKENCEEFCRKYNQKNRKLGQHSNRK